MTASRASSWMSPSTTLAPSATNRLAAASPNPLAAPVMAAIARLRQEVATLGEDRFLAPDIAKATTLIADGTLITETGIDMPELS